MVEFHDVAVGYHERILGDGIDGKKPEVRVRILFHEGHIAADILADGRCVIYAEIEYDGGVGIACECAFEPVYAGTLEPGVSFPAGTDEHAGIRVGIDGLLHADGSGVAHENDAAIFGLCSGNLRGGRSSFLLCRGSGCL